MSEDALIRHAAPTLAGLKTASLFCCGCDSWEALARELRGMNRVLSPKGLRLVPLRISEGRALLYLYRPARLQRDLAAHEARVLLREAGYPAPGKGRCLAELSRRLRRGGDFPHEIGLFLGYPPEDVRGFIAHDGRDEKCAGCWKVYGDAETARRTFEAYHHCTDHYCKRRAMGATVAQLAVGGE